MRKINSKKVILYTGLLTTLFTSTTVISSPNSIFDFGESKVVSAANTERPANSISPIYYGNGRPQTNSTVSKQYDVARRTLSLNLSKGSNFTYDSRTNSYKVVFDYGTDVASTGGVRRYSEYNLSFSQELSDKIYKVTVTDDNGVEQTATKVGRTNYSRVVQNKEQVGGRNNITVYVNPVQLGPNDWIGAYYKTMTVYGISGYTTANYMSKVEALTPAQRIEQIDKKADLVNASWEGVRSLGYENIGRQFNSSLLASLKNQLNQKIKKNTVVSQNTKQSFYEKINEITIDSSSNFADELQEIESQFDDLSRAVQENKAKVDQFSNLGNQDKLYQKNDFTNQISIDGVSNLYNFVSNKDSDMAGRKQDAISVINNLDYLPQTSKDKYSVEIKSLKTLSGDISNSQPQIDDILNKAKLENHKIQKKNELENLRQYDKTNIIDKTNHNIDDQQNIKDVDKVFDEAFNILENTRLEYNKHASIVSIDNFVNNAINEISSLNNVDESTKNTQISKVVNWGSDFKSQINSIDSIDKIQPLIDSVQNQITQVVNETKLMDAKIVAKQEVKKTADRANQAIHKMPGLTDEERTDAKQKIDQAQSNANTSIDDSNSFADITSSQNNGQQSITDIVNSYAKTNADNISTAKKNAKENIKDTANQAKNIIDKTGGLSDQQKADAKAAIDQEVSKANTNIDNAQNPTDINIAQNNGQKSIQGVVDQNKSTSDSQLTDAKTTAKQEVQKTADRANQAIHKMPGLTDEERTDAKQKIDQAQSNANTSIGDSNSFADITSSQNNGQQSITDIVNSYAKTNADNISTAKENAKENIKDTANQAKNIIDKTGGLSDQQKADAKAAIDQEVSKANTNIDNAQNPTDINIAQNNGQKSIQGVVDQNKSTSDSQLTDAKTTAKQEVQKTADRANQAIHKMPGLTDEERTDAKQKIDQAQSNANTSIGDSNSFADITSSQNNGQQSITDIVNSYAKTNADNISTAKENAKENIKDTANQAKNIIDKTGGLSDQQKADAKAAIDQEVSKANTNIDNAQNPTDINIAQNNGQKAIQGVVDQNKSTSDSQLTDAKTTAKQEVQKTVDQANQNIDSVDKMPGLTDEERADAKQKITQAQSNANTSIDNSNSFADITSSQNNGQQSITDIVNSYAKTNADNISTAKENAKENIKDTANQAKNIIDKTGGLSDQQKADAKAAIDQEVSKANTNIDNAQNPTDINIAQNNGQKAIQGVVDQNKSTSDSQLTDAKTTAKQEVQKTVDQANQNIDSVDKMPGLTDEERADAKQKITQAQSNANTSIDNSNSFADITSSQNNGQQSITDIVNSYAKTNADNISTAKENAKENIKDTANQAKNIIDKTGGLSDQQKADAKAAIDQEVSKANTNIDNAQNPTDINIAQNNGQKAIQGVVDQNKSTSDSQLTDAKTTAKQEVQKTVDQANQNIDSVDKMPGLTDEERADAKQKITQAQSNANTSIDNSNSFADITSSQNNGQQSITDIVNSYAKTNADNISTAKENAKENIKDTANQAKNIIDKTGGLSDQQKADAKAAIDQEVSKANANIDDAQNPTDINTAQNNGQKAIQGVVDQNKATSDSQLTDAKTTAKQEVQKTADRANQAIHKMPGLTDEERTDAKQKIDQAQSNANTSIGDSNSFADITSSQNNGQQSITDIVNSYAKTNADNISTAKENAKENIKDTANQAKNIIDKTGGLSDQQKADAKAAIDQEVSKANTNIDNAQNPTDINIAQNNGQKAIQGVVDQNKSTSDSQLTDAKTTAKQEVQKTVDQANQNIDSVDKMPGLTDEERADAKQKITQAQSNANTSIDNSNSFADITSSQNNGQQSITDIVNSYAKTNADNISTAKENAKENIKDTANQAKNIIDKTGGLSDQQKADAKAAIDQEVSKANTNIDNAQNPTDINIAQNNGQKAIQGVVDQNKSTSDSQLTDAKTTAKQEVQKTVDQANQNIDSVDKMPGLTDEERADAKQKITQAQSNANTSIDNSNSFADITSSQNNGQQSITDIVNSYAKTNADNISTAKENAKENIKDTANQAKNIIDKTGGLSDQQKADAKAAIDQEVSKANTNIDNAQNPTDINIVQNNGQKAIQGVVDQNKSTSDSQLTDAKTTAKQEVQKTVDQANQNIDSVDKMPGLTDEERADAKQKITQAQSNANTSIDNSNSFADITSSQNNGQQSITDIVNSYNQTNSSNLDAAKRNAKQNIEQTAEQAKVTIDKMLGLSDQQIKAAKATIDQEVSKANTNIDNAQNPTDINTAQNNGQKAIQGVVDKYQAANNLTLDQAKQSAKNEVQKTEIQANTDIDDMGGLSPDLISKAKNEIAKALDSASRAIDLAKSPTDINTGQDNGQKSITDIVNNYRNQSESNLDVARDLAKQNIQEAADQAKQTIDKMNALSDQQKTETKAEIDEIVDLSNSAIDLSNSPNDINASQNQGQKSIQDAVSTANEFDQAQLVDIKDQAKEAIMKAADLANKNISNLPGLSKDDIQEAKNEISQAVDNANQAINQGKTPSDVKQAQANGEKSITDIVNNYNQTSGSNLDAAKQKAKQNVQQAADQGNSKLDKLSNLTPQQKQEAIDKIRDIVSQANGDGQKIDIAETPSDINQAQNNAQQAINDLINSYAQTDQTQLTNNKDQVKEEVKKAANQAKETIDKMPGLTSDDITKSKTEIDNAVDNATQAIDQGKTPSDVNQAGVNGKQSITDIVNSYNQTNSSNLDAVKQKAKQNVQQAADQGNSKLDKLSNLTPPQKQEAIDKIRDIMSQANGDGQKIDIAETPSDINQAQNNAQQAINDLINSYAQTDQTQLTNNKDQVKEEVKKAANQAKETIDKMPGLTSDDITKAKTEIDNAVNNATQAIDQGKTPSDVKQAQANGEKSITDIVNSYNQTSGSNLDAAKQKAKQNVQQAADQGNSKLDKLSNLTPQQKQEAIDKIRDIVSQANGDGQKIDIAETPSDINQAQNNAQQAINDLINSYAQTDQTQLTNNKDQVKEEVKKAANQAKETIDKMPGLTSDDITKSKTEIDNAVDNATQAIDQGKTPSDVNQAGVNGKQSITDIVNSYNQTNSSNLDAVKQKAKQNVQQAADQGNSKLDKLSNLTPQQKQETIDKIRDIVSQANGDGQKIDIAETPGDINQDQNNAQQAINDLINSYAQTDQTQLTNNKDQVKEEVKKAANQAKETLDKMPGLISDDITKAKTEIDNAVNNATQAIDQGKTPSDVKQAQANGEKSITDIVNSYNQTSGSNLDAAKQKAKQNVQQAADQGNSKLDKLSNLTPQQKQEAIDKIRDVVSQANGDGQKIDIAETPSDINQAQNNAQQAINDLINSYAQTDQTQLTNNKDQVKEEIKKAVNQAKETIDKMPGLTSDDITKAKTEIDNAVNNATQAIDQGKTPSDVNQAGVNGKQSITDIVNSYNQTSGSNLDAAKQKAKQNVQQAADQGNSKLDKLSNLTPQQKQEAIDKIRDIVSQANGDGQKIDIAETPSDINQAQNNAQQAINDLINSYAQTDQTQLTNNKDQVKEEVKKVANQAKETIDKMPGLTSDDITKSKTEIDNAVDNATQAIDQGKTPSDVNQAGVNGKQSITDIVNSYNQTNSSNLDAVKQKAKQNVQQAADQGNSKLDKLSNLTPQQKQEAIDKIRDIVSQANGDGQKIDIAETPGDINQAQNNAQQAINDLINSYAQTDQTQLTNNKDQVKEEVKKAANQAKETIDKMPGLISDDITKAKTEIDNAVNNATQAIDQGKTPSDVNQAGVNGKQSITDIVNSYNQTNSSNLDAVKQKAKQNVQQAADQGNSKLDKLSNLTPQQKQETIDKIRDIVSQANGDGQKIDIAETPGDINQDQNNAQQAINDLINSYAQTDQTQLTNNKDQVKEEVKKAANQAKETIDKMPGLISDDITKAKTEIDNAVNNATQAIDQGKTPSDVNQAGVNGKQSITDIVNSYNQTNSSNLDAAKQKAKQNVQQAADQGNSKIDKLSNLTPQQKQEAINAITNIVNQANGDGQKIDIAETPGDINQDQNNAYQAIIEIVKNYTHRNDVEYQHSANNDVHNQLLNKKSQIIYSVNKRSAEVKDNINDQQKENIEKTIQAVNNATTFNDLDVIHKNAQNFFNQVITNRSYGLEKIVNYIDGYGIQNWRLQSDGSFRAIPGSYTPTKSTVQTFESKIVNGKKYVRVTANSESYWVQSQYLDDDYTETLISGTLTVNAPSSNYLVFLRDQYGNMMEQFVTADTQWRVFAQKIIDGKLYYRIGNDNQWIESMYVNF